MPEMQTGGLTQERKRRPIPPDRLMEISLVLFAASLIAAALLLNTPYEILRGSFVILSSPANLVTDHFHIANPGAALVNAAIMAFQAIVMVRLCRYEFNGMVVAAIFTLAGFSLFGKNLYNSLPIIGGVYAYSRFKKTPFCEHIAVSLFGTALAPLVSEVSFNVGLPLPVGILLGVLAGLLAGFIMPVLAKHFAGFHKGYSLYNIGFTAGIIGTFFIAVFRCFGIEVDTVSLVSKGHNRPMAIYLYALFAAMLLLGLALWLRGPRKLKALFRDSGHRSDFIDKYGLGPVFLNMALLGLLSTTYILLVGGELNGPTIGGVFTVVGFGAWGKHVKNVAPLLLGIFLVAHFSVHDTSSTAALLAALFGTTLAPLSGYFGPAAGLIAGGLHIALTTNITFLHAGMNLYNNGFSGGFVAALLVPILERIRQNVSGADTPNAPRTD